MKIIENKKLEISKFSAFNSGLLRSARNDVKRETKAESLTSLAWGNALRNQIALSNALRKNKNSK